MPWLNLSKPTKMIKKILKRLRVHRLLPHQLRQKLALITNYWYDFKVYLKSSSMMDESGREQQSSQLIMRYHAIEKGLSVPSPRKNFGQDKVIQLMDRLDTYRSQFGHDHVVVACLNALSSYLDYSVTGGVCESVRQYLSTIDAVKSNAVLNIKGVDVIESASINFAAFCRSRHSIRNFTGEAVDNSLIEKAVDVAKKTPSVCNRQTSRVHVLRGDKKKRILDIQLGSRGFSDCIDTVLVMTSDRRAFTGIGERNQCWVDSGMFAMSVIYSLHALGLGSCCLNWSFTSSRDQLAREVFSIDEAEAISMIIAVGHIPEVLNVASSPRFPTFDILTIHD